MIIVIRSGTNQYLTLSSIRFQQLGGRRPLDIIFCDNWVDGFKEAKQSAHSAALFVDAGTVFYDWDKFAEMLAKYPHQGLVGHIVDPLDSTAYYLHEQCFYLELNQFDASDFVDGEYSVPSIVRSEANIHDSYTPLWIRPAVGAFTQTASKFGEKLIAKQLNNGYGVVNFHQKLRQYKQFIYQPEDLAKYIDSQQSNFDLAEKLFWVFNNEQLNIRTTNTRLATPASGLFWILNLSNPTLTNIDLVDISKTQIEFAKHLWNTWDGINYGKVVADYIKTNKLIHYQLDDSKLDRLEMLKLKSPVYLESRVNDIFNKQCAEYGINDFVSLWQNRYRVSVTFTNDSIIKYLLTTTNTGYDLWMSNILDYKYNLLKHSKEELEAVGKGTAWTLRKLAN